MFSSKFFSIRFKDTSSESARAKALGVSQPTVSHHLKLLRDRCMVKAERDGTSVYYSLADQRIIEALDIMRQMLADIMTHRASLMGVSR